MIILPASELEVMNRIWDAEQRLSRPATTSDIAPYLPQIKTTTVITLAFRLVSKGFVRIEKVGRTNLYVPEITREQYRKEAYADFLRRVMDGDREELGRILIEDMTAEERAKLSDMVTERA